MTEPTLKETFYSDGSIRWREWRLNRKLHRKDGPAYIIYYQILGNKYSTEKHRVIYRQIWSINGKLNREDGPAYIVYKLDGSVYRQEWYLKGWKLTEEEYKRKIANRHKVLLLQSNLIKQPGFEKWLIPEIVNFI